jgi:peptidoglycan-associated lipoprotein
MQKPLAILMSLALLAGCSATPPATNQPATTTPSGPALAQQAKSSQVATGAKPSLSELDDPSSRLARRNVYFAYDNFTVDTKYEQMISAHASYLTHNPAAHVSLEGNADERGSREYNLALGQKRADAVRSSLKLHGVPDQQMEAISYGKEKPKSICHDESCWQENRRADIVYRVSR